MAVRSTQFGEGESIVCASDMVPKTLMLLLKRNTKRSMSSELSAGLWSVLLIDRVGDRGIESSALLPPLQHHQHATIVTNILTQRQ
jgi:hypothetical protein